MTLARPGFTRILKGARVQIEIQPYVAGVATAPDSGTITITGADGTVIVNADAISVSGTKGIYQLTETHTANVDELTAVWTVSVASNPGQIFRTYHLVVGALLFTLAEARAYDASAMANTTTYPAATLAEGRDIVTDAIEDVIGVALGGRYAREVISGGGSSELWLSRVRPSTIRAAEYRTFGTQTWTALTADELADILIWDSGLIARESLGSFTSGSRNWRITYEHGWQPIPNELRQAGLALLRERVVSSALPARATSQTNEFGSFALSTAGRGSEVWFGLPGVDSVLARYRERVPTIA